ncbi:hypothetical protein [Ruegeria sp.]|uniref:hypothetical protein n=1 Tax=Ruegeria sp. TaxID=1879320 RepID=UPI00231FE720|nr:hypothetical protein [Ruegeria sp.]MDA7967023.1 hypothetical protein [Ruegeria sp.]
MPLDHAILGQGVYTPREAARLVGANVQQVLRWTRGSGPHLPLWNAHYQFLDDDINEISFLDLIEVRVVAAMRNANISLQSIRFAISFAQDKFGIERPLASQSFKTDGSEILMEAIENDGEYVSLSKKRPGQKVFKDIISQSLNDLEYDGEVVARWRPRNHADVVLDPTRHFGDPILDEFGISTGTIYKEYVEFNDTGYLSKIYEVPEKLIRKCIKFERSLDEANG